MEDFKRLPPMDTDGHRWEICKLFTGENALRLFYPDYSDGKLKSKRNTLTSFRIGQKIKYQLSVFIVPYPCPSVVFSFFRSHR